MTDCDIEVSFGGRRSSGRPERVETAGVYLRLTAVQNTGQRRLFVSRPRYASVEDGSSKLLYYDKLQHRLEKLN